MRNLSPVLLLAFCGFGAAACDASDAGDGSDFEEGEAPSDNSGEIQSGTLTAGAWDDNRNYAYFRDYLAAHDDLEGAPPIPEIARDAARDEFAGDRTAVDSLDIVFAVDNTGSMGDEIAFLKAEFSAIADSIGAEFPDMPIRWATIAYRDHGDAFDVLTSPFTSDASLIDQRLSDMEAAGGDDYPEDVAGALESATQLNWASQGRIMFLIADAPHHAEDATSVASSLMDLSDGGVHIYPVAASGADELTELTLRSAAQLTGGRYLFLTDDSGVGDEHKEPVVPCYFVTRLDHAILRMVRIEVSGVYSEPEPSQILRTGGDPENGACELDDGTTVVAF